MSEHYELIKKIKDIAKQDIEQMSANGYDNIDRKCFGESVDILKDAMQMEYFSAETAKACLEKEYMEMIKIPNKIMEGELTKRMVEDYDDSENDRYGYRGRARNGRFVHRSGRGRSAGYMPYMRIPEEYENDWMEDEFPPMITGYRMGYPNRDDRNNMDGNGWSGNRSRDHSRYGYEPERKRSKYGDACDRYDNYCRHYTENKDTKKKKKMEESMTEIFNDMEDMVESVMKYADASEKPALKQKIVQMAQKVQSMN